MAYASKYPSVADRNSSHLSSTSRRSADAASMDNAPRCSRDTSLSSL
jgi:hypothetical protein